MDQHDSTLRYRVSCWVAVDPTLRVAGRKAFEAMVNIDGTDGRDLRRPCRPHREPARESGIKGNIISERARAATYTQTKGF